MRDQAVQQVGAADDADELAVVDDRHPLDPLPLEQRRDLGQLGVGRDRRPRRAVITSRARLPWVFTKSAAVTLRSSSSSSHCDRRRSVCASARRSRSPSLTMPIIAPVGVEHRHRADAVLEQQPSRSRPPGCPGATVIGGEVMTSRACIVRLPAAPAVIPRPAASLAPPRSRSMTSPIAGQNSMSSASVTMRADERSSTRRSSDRPARPASPGGTSSRPCRRARARAPAAPADRTAS